MDETLRRISDLLVRRRAELQEHFKNSDQDNSTESLVDRVERLKSRLESSVRRDDDGDDR